MRVALRTTSGQTLVSFPGGGALSPRWLRHCKPVANNAIDDRIVSLSIFHAHHMHGWTLTVLTVFRGLSKSTSKERLKML